MLAYRAGDDAEPGDVVPVVIAVTLPRGVVPEVDDEGSRDVLGDTDHSSWFITERVPPKMMAIWDPGSSEWIALEDWNDLDVDLGVKETEMFDENGDPTTDPEEASSTAVTVFGPYESGGFKPDMDDSEAWGEE
jgi:hypothetical protein